MSKKLLLPLVMLAWTAVSLPAGAQTCHENITSTSPDSRYMDNGDGTISDQWTGLMWKTCSEGQSGSDCATGTLSGFQWAGALQHVEQVNAGGGFAGYTDWRVPNYKEYISLTEKKCYWPSINTTFFPNTQAEYYYSSLPYYSSSVDVVGSLSYVWSVDFSNGSVGSTVASHVKYIRLVRGGN